MQDARAVHRCEAGRDPRTEGRHLRRRKIAALLEQAAQRRPADVIHDDGEARALDDEVVHADDVRAAQIDEQVAFLEETRDDGGVVSHLGAQQLEREGAAVDIATGPHLTHRARADSTFEHVPAAQLPTLRHVVSLPARSPRSYGLPGVTGGE